MSGNSYTVALNMVPNKNEFIKPSPRLVFLGAHALNIPYLDEIQASLTRVGASCA